MKKVLFSISTIAMFVMGFAAMAFAQSVAGEWEATITSPQGAQTSKLVIKDEGGSLSGALKGERGELPVKVALSGSDIKINFSVKFQDTDLPITLTGKVTGDAMKGDADFGGFAQGDWSAKRSGGAVPAASSSASATSSTAGSSKWDLTYTSPVGDIPVSAVVKQDGDKLSGTAKMGGPNPQEAPLTGTIKGDTVEFKIVIKYEGNDLPITSKGKIAGNDLAGSADYGGMAQGDFKGKKSN